MGFRTVYRNDRMPEAGLQVRAMLGSHGLVDPGTGRRRQ